MPDEIRKCGTCEHWKRATPVLNEHSLARCGFFAGRDVPQWMILGREPNNTGEGLTPENYGIFCAVWSPKGART